MKEESGEDELGKWLSVNAAGGCYDDLRVLQSEPLHEWSNAGRSRLHPAHHANSSSGRDSVLQRKSQSTSGRSSSECHSLLIRSAAPPGIAVVRNIARCGHQVRAVTSSTRAGKASAMRAACSGSSGDDHGQARSM